MDDSLTMRCLQCVRDLDAVLQGLLKRRGPFASRAASVSPSRYPSQEVDGDVRTERQGLRTEGRCRDRALAADVVQRADVG